MRLTTTTALLALIHHTIATPWPFPFLNTTMPPTTALSTNVSTESPTTQAEAEIDTTPDTPTTETSILNLTLSTPSGGPYKCTYAYPSDLTVVNSRYPTYAIDHLHRARHFFMLRRQTRNEGEIATRVQFTSLPPASLNETCRLEFVYPPSDSDSNSDDEDSEVQRISGPNPTFNVYRVHREVGDVATWETYVGNSADAEVFGQANGEKEARDRIRSVGGVAALNQTRCEEVLTFQMGMAFDAPGEWPNYWAFRVVKPPASPVMGFRVVWGC